MLDFDGIGLEPPFGPEDSRWYRALIHEWGHYGLGCRDEYEDADGNDYPEDENGVRQGPDGIMNNPFAFSELTTEISYHPDNWVPPNDPDTGLPMETTEHWADKEEGCWKTFFDNYYDAIFFDLDGDGMCDDEYDMTYEANVGPEVSESSQGSHCRFELMTGV
jgi:hypothetical protein